MAQSTTEIFWHRGSMNSVCNEAKMLKEGKQRYVKIQKDRWLGHKTL